MVLVTVQWYQYFENKRRFDACTELLHHKLIVDIGGSDILLRRQSLLHLNLCAPRQAHGSGMSGLWRTLTAYLDG
jgi:hypothetical protein